MSPVLAALLVTLELDGNGAAAWQCQLALAAAQRLERANASLCEMQQELAARLLGDAVPAEPVGELITALVRMQRHARRFRGQRDRALRTAVRLTQQQPR